MILDNFGYFLSEVTYVKLDDFNNYGSFMVIDVMFTYIGFCSSFSVKMQVLIVLLLGKLEMNGKCCILVEFKFLNVF